MLDARWAALNTSAAILEGFADFKAEVSFFGLARDGSMVKWARISAQPKTCTKNGILAKSTAPAPDISANALEGWQ